jgi:dTDP-4-dehydrorhamnose 3,5-epimerase
MKPLEIDGAWVLDPRVFSDSRGSFREWLRGDELYEAIGEHMTLRQANCTVSYRGTLRGIHFTEYPPGQSKYVTCVRGAVLDVITDIRVGSPTYGQSSAVQLDERSCRALYIAPGLGHSYMALSDVAMMVYLCSSVYDPARERAVSPVDPELGIAWPEDVPLVLSDRDRVAPGLAEARELGFLPSYEDCQAARLSQAESGVQ